MDNCTGTETNMVDQQWHSKSPVTAKWNMKMIYCFKQTVTMLYRLINFKVTLWSDSNKQARKTWPWAHTSLCIGQTDERFGFLIVKSIK